jgi:hypothetical protein
MGLGRDLILPSLAENAVIAAIDAGVVAVAYLALGWGVVDTFGLVILIEAAFLMLVGGAMEFATSSSGRAFFSFVTKRKSLPSAEELKKAEGRAATFALVGVLLFLEALALALIF